MEKGENEIPTAPIPPVESVEKVAVTETAEAVAPVEPMPAPEKSDEPIALGGEKKSSKGMIAGLIILAVVAIAGIAFGAYEMMQASEKDKEIAGLNQQVTDCANASGDETENETVTCPDGTATEIVKNVITNDLAQNLINPYIVIQGYLRNIFDLGLNDDTKFYIAYNNSDDYVTSYLNGTETIHYSGINNEFKYLFGSSSDLAKKDYTSNCSANYMYNSDRNMFNVEVKGCGGTGSAMFNIVKDAKFEDENIIVNVYHNVVPICYPDVDDEYCMDIGVNSAIINSIDQYNMRDYIEKFADSIPIYTMTFVKDDGHYVLNNIQKQ